MPETMSIERRKLLVAYGAKLVLTEGAKGMAGAVAKAEEIAASDPDRYVLLQQFKNPANPAIHEATTGPEIWEDTGGPGRRPRLGRRHRRHHHRRLALHQEDARQGDHVASPSSRRRARSSRRSAPASRSSPGPHKIQGIGAGFIPDVLDLSLVDAVEQVTNEEAVAYARRLAREEGILSGISCGAAAAVAVRLAQAARERRQDDRRHPARLGRALPELRSSSRGSSTRAGIAAAEGAPATAC